MFRVYDHYSKTSFPSPIAFFDFSKDNWTLSTQLIQGEDAESWNHYIDQLVVAFKIRSNTTIKIGSQYAPYGIATRFDRPSKNWFASSPRAPYVDKGVALNIENLLSRGSNLEMFFNGEHFAMRYSLRSNFFKSITSFLDIDTINSEFGVSINTYDFNLNDDNGFNTDFEGQLLLLDAFASSKYFDLAYELNLSDAQANNSWHWLRAAWHPTRFLKIGDFQFGLTFGFSSYIDAGDKGTAIYGVSYRDDSNFQISTEYSSKEEILFRLGLKF